MPPSGNGGRSRGGKVRVKTAKRRSAQSTRWLERQLNDPYVAAAKAHGYRSRAAFKLKELDEQFGLLNGVERVVDLGAAPGGWCQVVKQKKPKARVVGMDLLAIEPMAGVDFFQKDITDEDSEALILATLGGPADLVMSDMAANTVGHKQTDHLRTMGLIEVALDMATRLLRPGGNFLAKVLAGGGDGQLTAALRREFTSVKHVKPPASRKGSSEWYVVATGFKGGAAGGSTQD
ncbi:rRNA methyltransferase [Sandarakinorhabdus cyanobacteriorum]|uniref:Ribosomal RNA large subunit methyltransferase E n=2 Tax=Sandarakinorhabdus cyanobacteriorum TaxID=1981098 RepID=A0A255Z3R5_9SPHN|nr:rRNA methyltransferase [Sandarakinorhabdus cyanobacteriorum]